jgi:hypothetical protein
MLAIKLKVHLGQRSGIPWVLQETARWFRYHIRLRYAADTPPLCTRQGSVLTRCGSVSTEGPQTRLPKPTRYTTSRRSGERGGLPAVAPRLYTRRTSRSIRSTAPGARSANPISGANILVTREQLHAPPIAAMVLHQHEGVSSPNRKRCFSSRGTITRSEATGSVTTASGA